MSQGQALHAGGLRGHNAVGRVFDGQALARLQSWFVQLGDFLKAAEGFEIYFRVRLGALAVIGRGEYREFLAQAQLPKKMVDFHSEAAAGNGQSKMPGGLEDELHRAGHGWQSVVDDLLVGARLPCQQLIAPGGAQGASVTLPEVVDNATVIESEVIPIIFFFREAPTLSGRHFLDELHDKRFAVNEDAVKIKNDSAEQESGSP